MEMKIIPLTVGMVGLFLRSSLCFELALVFPKHSKKPGKSQYKTRLRTPTDGPVVMAGHPQSRLYVSQATGMGAANVNLLNPRIKTDMEASTSVRGWRSEMAGLSAQLKKRRIQGLWKDFLLELTKASVGGIDPASAVDPL